MGCNALIHDLHSQVSHFTGMACVIVTFEFGRKFSIATSQTELLYLCFANSYLYHSVCLVLVYMHVHIASDIYSG